MGGNDAVQGGYQQGRLVSEKPQIGDSTGYYAPNEGQQQGTPPPAEMSTYDGVQLGELGGSEMDGRGRVQELHA